MDSSVVASTNVSPSLLLNRREGFQIGRSPSDDNVIRTKLFHRLGIVGPLKPPPQLANNKSMASMAMKSRGSIRSGHFNTPLLEPIKCNCAPRQDGEDKTNCSSKKCHCGEKGGENAISFTRNTSDSTATNAEKEGKGVRFTNTAQVWLIPRRQDYSQRLRKLLWYERHEHLINVRRNTIEFWYEGWNWRTVMEEQYMYTNKASGERVHPVHVQYYWKLQQQQQLQQQPTNHLQLAQLQQLPATVPGDGNGGGSVMRVDPMSSVHHAITQPPLPMIGN